MSCLKINTELCRGCGMCARDCIAQCLKVENHKITIVEEEASNCFKCGHCSSICKSKAITLFEKPLENVPEGHKDVIDAIKTRRSTRSFKGPIPKEELTELINLTRFSPSAKNWRPIKYLIPEIVNIFGNFLSVDLIVRKAPHVVIAYVDDSQNVWANDDGTIALTQLELAATNKGYGSLWCGLLKFMFSFNECLDIVGLKGKKVVGCLAMGVPLYHYTSQVPREDVPIIFLE
ncbi:hypothetical protein EIN_119610 [Entamoeba invadens IP1]|uniref:4Fe-4S ferredoxin-type domain-containing protein n=1 Tax=Entamoeba invadens IP1 TaxID=370355 RepID=L7FN34_ENTIV|nr:hypothetical protein EIN_119610 [Entamoeba invadens IP1]ELP92287.1 hypothetical protein EIN_119610 [Entamoeba invadens IP1]|eukprot:XP_004259058.1 hypothetical protein EIN_119610 [Entamoeba invadens IP1]